ncbi:uncharacterized protein LOC109727404 [Ananas comosus]|uniref:Uncharacterized protein LOC109727404 n=1 Tax=Ananas comosus TaxID=4615 RepID=A0A199VKX3_ANACO|nr:uncharacterized protein LOC109727404 [Ananas comosus]OAY77822.1 hypothetical protein ACMD2_03226 [Ananas comosus]
MEEESSDRGGDTTREAKATSHKGKSCKGCLYYSSLLKSESRGPMCFGISRTHPQVPSYVVGESDMQAAKDGHSLSDFKYVCVGYSVFLDNKDSPSEKRENQAELPSCVGIKVLVDRRPSTASHAPSYVHREDTGARAQPRGYKPGHSSVEEFLSRLSRNAGLVASSAARNLQKVGNYVKENIDDILYPYRRPPK